MIEVSIITVNYNETNATITMLESLSHVLPGIEIIIVDNGSEPNPESSIKAQFPDITFIRSEKNLGFAGGNNLGIAVAQGNYLLFLNNDTVIHTTNFITCLTEYLSAHPRVAAISPMIAHADEQEKIQFAGYTNVNPYTGRNRTLGESESVRDIRYLKPQPTPYLHGAAMMVRKSVISEVGFMPEDYFLYYEEYDWSCAIRRHGYELHYVPCGPVLHTGSLSTAKTGQLKTYYMNRNRLLFMRRHVSHGQYAVFLVYYSLVALPWQIVKCIVKGNPKDIPALFNAFFWNLRTPAYQSGEDS